MRIIFTLLQCERNNRVNTNLIRINLMHIKLIWINVVHSVNATWCGSTWIGSIWLLMWTQFELDPNQIDPDQVSSVNAAFDMQDIQRRFRSAYGAIHHYSLQYPIIWGNVSLSGEATLSKQFCCPFEKRSTLKGKKMGAFLLFRVDPFSKGVVCRKANRKSEKLSPL